MAPEVYERRNTLFENISSESWDTMTTAAATDTTTYQTTTVSAEMECDGWTAVNLWVYLGPMIGVTVLLAFTTRRLKKWLNILDGRPGVLYPVNFIDEHNRRWAYAAVFGILSYEILDLFYGVVYWNPKFVEVHRWSKVFVKLVNILILSAIFYPLTVCIRLRRYLLANILGLLITGFFLSLTFLSFKVCNMYDAVNSQAGRLTQILLIPVYICYLVLLCTFTRDGYLNIKKKCDECKGRYEIKKKKKSHNILYMEGLMRRRELPKVGKGSRKERIIARVEKVKYEPIEGLRYSPRVICTMVVASFILYKVATFWGYWLDAAMLAYISATRITATQIKLFTRNSSEVRMLEKTVETLTVLRYSLIVAHVISAILQTIFIILMVVTYRKHFRMLVKGEFSWLREVKKAPASLLLSGMKYSGYQIAYIIYGYFIVVLIVTGIVGFFVYFIVLPIKYDRESWPLNFLKSYWPTAIVGLLIQQCQKLLAKYAFLQDRGKYLALNNRRAYHVACFLLFFFNIIVGLFACLKRVLLSLIIGTFMLPRLDHCLLIQGFEKLDSGYQAYLGMLMVDVQHNHPILKAAIEVLQERVNNTSYLASSRAVFKLVDLTVTQMEEGKFVGIASPTNTQDALLRRKQVRNKWWKLVTLLNNQELVLEKAQQEMKQRKRAGEDKGQLAVGFLDSGEMMMATSAMGGPSLQSTFTDDL